MRQGDPAQLVQREDLGPPDVAGYVLTREPASITVLDVVEAVDGPEQAFVCTEIRQRGPLGTPAEQCTTPCPISRAMAGADRAWREALHAVTIADLVRDVADSSGPTAIARIGTWLGTPEA